MTKNFPFGNGLVFGAVTSVPCNQFFFVRNGDPRQILCHVNQCGTLVASAEGQILLRQDDWNTPRVGDRVVLIRESDQPSHRGYTKADRCALENDWHEVQWAISAQRTFRCVAFNHRSGGHFQANTRTEVELVKGKLVDIARSNPRTPNDPLANHYSTTLGGLVLSYDTRWERLEDDGGWTEHTDPRPKS